MGKKSNDLYEKKVTRVLYKKSMSTFRTRSKTYSGHSQIYNKSGILPLNIDISQTNTFNTHNEKRKRDLAIETNVCMLRNHYIKKRIKRSHYDTTSAKSKFSAITNLKDPDDTTASGDSKQTPEVGGNAATLKNTELVSVIVDNFKALLNKWIHEIILEHNENSQKVDTVRDSLLHKLELDVPKENISHATFVYHSKISKEHTNCNNRPKGKKKYTSTSKAKDKLKSAVKFSCYTIPFQCKKLRVVSTLSIPRQFEMSSLKNKNSHDNAFYTVRKISRKDLYLSLKKNKKLVLGSSTLHLLAMSSRSLTKRCATYKVDSGKKEIITKKVAFQQKEDKDNMTKPIFAIENNSTDSTTSPKQDFDNVPSLVKSIYGGITPAASPSYVFLMSDNYTMTEYSTSPDTTNGESESSECNARCHDHKYCETNMKSDILSERDYSDPMLTIDFISQSLEFPPITIGTPSTPKNILHKKVSSRNYRAFKKRTHLKSRRLKNNTSNTDNIKPKHFTYLYKRVNRVNSENNEFLNHFQSILKHFTECNGQKNIRLDVHVNVFPIAEIAAPVSKTEINIFENLTNSKTELTPSRRSLDTLIESQETEGLSTKESKNLKSEGLPEIISLLDGAVSQAKYILVAENEYINHDNKIKELAKVSDGSTLTADLEISQEINELKSVIKGLEVTAEKLMSVHLQEKNNKKPQSHPETTVLFNSTAATTTSSESSQTPIMPKEQYKYESKGIQISECFIKENTHPEFKLKKEPKKPDKTELQARLMAKSTTYRFIESESILKVTDMTSRGNNAMGPNDVGLTCSFPKSKSLFEMTAEKDNRKLMAFYCDGLFRKHGHVTNDCSSILSSMCRPDYPIANSGGPSSAKVQPQQCQSIQTIQTIDLPGSPNCTSVSDCPEEGRNLISSDDINGDCPKCRRSVGFYEGCLYCLIIWIPVIIIMFLFYLTVIKRALPKKAQDNNTNSTVFYLKMSDLGF